MLPFQSRSVDSVSEELSTDDVEVVRHVRNAAQIAPSSKKLGAGHNLGSTLRSTERPSSRRYDRPQIPAPVPASTRAAASKSSRLPAYTASSLPASFQENEDEMTCLMPAKMLLPPPPAEVAADARVANLRPMSFRPSAKPQHQPRLQQPVSQPMYAPEETPFDARTAPERLRSRTPQPMRVMAARQESYVHIPAPPPSLAPMAMPSVDSDPRINPGATVLTSRSLAGRPTASWAAALVVMGIFAGIVTAAVARGDLGDAKVAAASQQPAVQQVIPSQAAASPAGPSMGQSFAATTIAPMAIGTPITTTQGSVVTPAPLTPAAPAAAPIAAKFSPTPHVAARAAAPAPAPVAHVAKARTEEPKEKKEIAVKPKKEGKGDGDMASAKEAQALADAQLAASL